MQTQRSRYRINYLFLSMICLPAYTCIAGFSFKAPDPYALKRLTDLNFKYEFYTTTKKLVRYHASEYFWFKGGVIHNSTNGAAGELLNEDFSKFYLNSQIAERGRFKNGLRIGVWKTWFRNGAIESVQGWHRGMRHGKFYLYNDAGVLLQQGRYKQNLKEGLWIDEVKHDTIKYREGIVVLKKVKLSPDEKKKAKAERKLVRAQKKAAQKELTPGNSRKGFFFRLFHKNEKGEGTEPENQGFLNRLFRRRSKEHDKSK